MAEPQETAAKIVGDLALGNMLVADFAIDLDPNERLELLVTRASDTGIRELEARYMGVLVRKLAAKPNTDGTVTWTAV